MISIKQFDSEEEFDGVSREDIVEFLYIHLGKYKDDKQSIERCLDYTFAVDAGKGGFLLIAYAQEKMVGVVVSIRTGMQGFIPENILVYIAVDENMRGQGIGARLINETKERVQGSIKLHVEYDNPAKKLYERLGFSTKYAEMRYTKNE